MTEQFVSDYTVLEEALKDDPTRPSVVFMLAALINKLNLRLEKVETKISRPNSPSHSTSRSVDFLGARKIKKVQSGFFTPRQDQLSSSSPNFLFDIVPKDQLEKPQSIKNPMSPDKSPTSSPDRRWITKKPTQVFNKELSEIEIFKKTLSRWTDKRMFKVIYNSKLGDQLNSDSFNKKIMGTNNVMIFVFDEHRNIFGGFTNKAGTVPNKEDHQYIEDDKAYFVFSLKNQNGNFPQKFQRKRLDVGLRFCNDDNCVFGLADCLSVYSDGKAYCHPTFSKYYLDEEMCGASVFNNTIYPNRFNVDCVIAIQWY
ncbi:hypothetical protein EIN_061010 [Entamoeba invadens IP1]|uniref:hypothetical protein n=1 Tax=Entamoeba invadens IP1 TaxID=370355 RepID=UPI0002C3E673|nr:hypothetical protein EIN_061010 [Entamoeba invadens IP1]ELP93536.1 hypothetical protein EIN_061010 [Entamoeba invadens IP1]|eukprot:XP_004260307.1 hypothetical protein EIN_061010 [Entamoeba invadens IP1]